jgi:hypothetical protein
MGRFGAISGGGLATKSKLEQAVERHAGKLNEAQGELVRAQFSTYRKNLERLSRLEDELKSVNALQPTTREEVRAKQAQRASLTYEQGQLSTANAKIASELFGFLEE